MFVRSRFVNLKLRNKYGLNLVIDTYLTIFLEKFNFFCVSVEYNEVISGKSSPTLWMLKKFTLPQISCVSDKIYVPIRSDVFTWNTFRYY
jgi:hypothetical protein